VGCPAHHRHRDDRGHRGSTKPEDSDSDKEGTRAQPEGGGKPPGKVQQVFMAGFLSENPFLGI
jgi:hypothetical protein